MRTRYLDRQSWIRRALLPLSRVDLALLCYILMLNGAILWRRPAGVWTVALAGHFALAVGIVLLAWLAHGKRSGAIHFFHLWYPQICFLIFFEEVGPLVHMIHPGWFDSYLIAFDHRLLGVHPTVWLEQYFSPWLTEIMQGSYFSYYLMLPVVGGVLCSRKRWLEFEALMMTAVFGYGACYLFFYLLPVEGPFHTLAALQRVTLHGGFFTELMDTLEKFGRVHGGAFPSAHVVGSMVSLLVAWKYVRKLAWVLTPIILCMLIATVYGRYHYLADVLAGLLVATAAFIAVRRIFTTEAQRTRRKLFDSSTYWTDHVRCLSADHPVRQVNKLHA